MGKLLLSTDMCLNGNDAVLATDLFRPQASYDTEAAHMFSTFSSSLFTLFQVDKLLNPQPLPTLNDASVPGPTSSVL